MTQTLKAIKGFMHRHDDEPAFHAMYCAAMVLCAAMFNLGTFVLFVIAHMTLDLVKYRELHGFSWRKTWKATMRESLLDITLVFLGLTFIVYMHHSLPHIAALSGLALAEITIIEFAGVFGSKLKILSDFMAAFTHLEHYMAIRHPRLAKPLTHLEKVCVISVSVSLFLLVTATMVLPLNFAELGEILLEELVPGLA